MNKKFITLCIIRFKPIVLILLFYCLTAHAWWDSDWNHRVNITVDNTSATAVTSYEVKLTIDASNAPNFDWSNNGNDIRFIDSDDMTMLAHFIESYDGIAEIATVWVNVPNIAAMDSANLFFYYDNSTATNTTDASATFSQSGLKYHTRNSTLDPDSLATAQSTFDGIADGTTGFGCSNVTAFTSLENSELYGSNNAMALTSEVFFNMPSGGTLQLRLGGDFGDGGGLYVDNTVIEELWGPVGTGDDMWWANTWASFTTSQEILYGSIVLSAGYHVLRHIGFEQCCDGDATLEYRIGTTGSWLAFNTSNLSLVSPQCPVSTAASFAAEETFDAIIGYVSSQFHDQHVLIEWQSNSESFNVGFNIWIQDHTGKWLKSNAELIPSEKINSLTPLQYHYRVDNMSIEHFQISSINIHGKEEFYRTYEVKKSYGRKTTTQSIDWSIVNQQNNTKIKQRNLLKNSQLTQIDQQDLVANIKTSKTGITRVYFDQLMAAGLDITQFDDNNLAVSFKGRAIARNVHIDHNSENSYVEFFAQTLNNIDALYLSQAIYQISNQPDLVKHSKNNRIHRPLTLTQSYNTTDTRDNNVVYNFASSSSDPWFEKLLANFGNGATHRIELTKPIDLALNDNINITLKMMGLTDYPGNAAINPDHHLKVILNNNTVIFDGFEDGIVDWHISIPLTSQQLEDGVNTLDLTLVSDTGFSADMVYFDKLEIDYTKPLAKNNQPLLFSTDQKNTEFELSGFIDKNFIAYAHSASGDLFELYIDDEPSNIDRIFMDQFEIQLTQHHYVDAINATGSHQYWFSDADTALAVDEIHITSKEKITLDNSHYLIISDTNFINHDLERFKNAKQQQGLKTSIISWQDIIEKNGNGYATPETLTRFLSSTYQHFRFTHVLLVGAQTYDYNNYLGLNTVNFIPTHYMKTNGNFHYTPTDFPYTDINKDGYPNFALGRWPVRTTQELNTIVNKTLTWQQQHPSNTINSLLIAEQQDQNLINFAEQADSVANTLQLDADLTQKVYVDDYLASSSDDPIAEAKNDLINHINGGVDLVIFDGHGSPTTWAYQNLFNTQDVVQLTNINHPFLLSPLSCYTTYYENPSTNTLAHQMLFSGQNAAVAIHGAMVLSQYLSNQNMATTTLKDMIERQSTLGEAIMRAKIDLYHAIDDNILNWSLLGDPAITL